MLLQETWSAKSKARNDKVLAAAVAEAQERGYARITRRGVATRAGVSLGCVNLSFGDMDGLKTAVLQEAVDRGLLELVAQGLADRHETALNAPQALRKRATATLI